MRMFAIMLTTLFLAVPVGASGPMTPSEFEAYVTGKTLTYSSNGVPYGIEEYLSNRRVRWAYLDGECQEGEWYPQGEMICFIYDAIDGPQCWTFYEEPSGLRALFMNDPEQTELYETFDTQEELVCLGPDVGV